MMLIDPGHEESWMMTHWCLEELKRNHERSKKVTPGQDHLSNEVPDRHVSQLVSAILHSC